MRRELLLPSRLLAVVAIAAATWSCQARPGPPPLPPGADPAFDRRLAELDRRYRFLFADSSRIFEARMVGAEEALLLDVGSLERSPDVHISGRLQLSPDRRWLLVSYYVLAFADHSNRHLLILDVRSREVRRVPILQDEDYGFDVGGWGSESCHWIAPDRFVISLSHYPPGGGIRKKFFEYDLADLSAPRALDFSDVEPVPSRRPNGPREVVVDSYHNAEPLFDFEDQRSHWDVEVDGRLARRTWNEAGTPRWDEDLALYTWHESDDRAGTSFVMDEAGRYRPWHRGRWIAKLPRGT